MFSAADGDNKVACCAWHHDVWSWWWEACVRLGRWTDEQREKASVWARSSNGKGQQAPLTLTGQMTLGSD